MARIDRARLDAPDYGTLMIVPTRYNDLDTQGHVNNAAAAVLLEEARANFTRALDPTFFKSDMRMMVAALTIEYAAEIRYPGTVEVRTDFLAIGRTSFTLGQVARQDGRAVLYGQSVMVTLDADGPAAVPETLRAAFDRARPAT